MQLRCAAGAKREEVEYDGGYHDGRTLTLRSKSCIIRVNTQAVVMEGNKVAQAVACDAESRARAASGSCSRTRGSEATLVDGDVTVMH